MDLINGHGLRMIAVPGINCRRSLSLSEHWIGRIARMIELDQDDGPLPVTGFGDCLMSFRLCILPQSEMIRGKASVRCNGSCLDAYQSEAAFCPVSIMLHMLRRNKSISTCHVELNRGCHGDPVLYCFSVYNKRIADFRHNLYSGQCQNLMTSGALVNEAMVAVASFM